MNIFATTICPIASAQALDDKRVVKMILETAQLLCTTVDHFNYTFSGIYKPTHKNHPCTVWARTSPHNYIWLAVHGVALCDEYSFRYGKQHKSRDVIEVCTEMGWELEPHFPLAAQTEFANCTPYKSMDDVCAAYRFYMLDKWIETDIRYPTWTRRGPPKWAAP
jgi:hypothetical protein